MPDNKPAKGPDKSIPTSPLRTPEVDEDKSTEAKPNADEEA